MFTTTRYMSLKDITLEIKAEIFNDSDMDIEKYAEHLSEVSPLDVYDVKNLYNCVYALYLEKVIVSKRRVWSYSEDSLIICYMDISKRLYSSNSITSVLKDLSEILIGRSEQSIVFRYYNVLKTKDEGNCEPVASVSDTSTEEHSEPIEVNQKTKGEDLLDVVIEVVENVETANVDVMQLFNGILALSKKAVDNSNEGKIKELEEQLRIERENNELLKMEIKELTIDMNLLKREFENFSKMSGKEKLKNIYSFNDSIMYIVDKYGNVSIK